MCRPTDTPRTIVPAAAPTAAADTGTTQAAEASPAQPMQQRMPIAARPPSPLAQAAQNISDELATSAERHQDGGDAGEDPQRRADRPHRRQRLAAQHDQIDARYSYVSTVWQPDAYDGRDAEFATADLQNPDTGQFVVYWARVRTALSAVEGQPHRAGGEGVVAVPDDDGQPHVSEPYSFAVANVSYVAATISAPILDPTGISPEPLGVFSIDVPLNSVGANLRAGDLPKGARIVLVDRNNDLAADSDPAWQPGSGISAPGEPFATYLVRSRGDRP